MKKKLFLSSFALVLSLGVGLVVGINNSSSAEPAKAEGTTRLYCKMEYSWWTADNAAIACHHWGDAAETTWPGTRMTPVATDSNVWYIDLDTTDMTGLIFARVNGTGDVTDWGAKTANLTVPTDGKNLYTITSSSAVWGDPGVEGEWSTYTEPTIETNDFYCYDPRGLLGSTVYAHSWNDDGHTTWPGNVMSKVTDYVYKAEVNSAYTSIIFNNGESTATQTVNITDLSSNIGKYFMIQKANSDGKLEGEWLDSATVPYSFGDTTMSTTNLFGSTGEFYLLYNQTVSASEPLVFKHKDVVIDNSYITAAVTEDNNVKKVDGVYYPYNDAENVLVIIWKNGENDYSIQLSGLVKTYTMQITSGGVTTSYPLTANPENEDELMTDEISIKAGDTLAVYMNETLKTMNPKAIGNNNVYSNEGVTTALLDMTGRIYVDKSASTIFASGMTFGEYGMVVNDSYVRLTKNPENENEWYVVSHTFNKDDVIRFINTTASDALPTIFDITTIADTSLVGVIEAQDGHLVVIADPSKVLNFYADVTYGANKVYFAEPTSADTESINFATNFNSALSAICKADGSTDQEALKTAWEAQATAFDSLSDDAKAILKNATTSHTNEQIATFAGKYDHIYKVYGSSLSLANFIDRAVSSNAINPIMNNTSATTIIIVCLVISTSLAVAGAFLLIKRRKHQ